MPTKHPLSPRSRSFFFYLLLAMVLLTVILVGLMCLNHFFTTRNLIDENYVQTQSQTEQNIVATIRLVDASFTLFDNSLNTEMNRGLDRVMQEYHSAGNDPAKMDLDAVRHELGDQFDIYIINESGVIEYTTYQPELGVDFKEIPYFFEYLTRIRNSEGFFPDRIVREERGTGPLRKYAYMPTADHKYILELGLSASAFGKERVALNSHDIINTLAANNPSIEQTRIFDITGRPIDDVTYAPNDLTRATLLAVISNRSGTVIEQPATGKSVTYLFIDLKNKEYGSDLSRVVEITYNKSLLDTVFARQFPRIALIAFIGLIIGCGLAFFLSRSLSQPIAGIVSVVDRIAKGDLDSKIGFTEITELRRLEQSINHMVASLREALDTVSESEVALMASERKYRDLYISARIALFEINLTSNTLVSGNQHLCDLFGVPSLDEIIGGSIFQDYIHRQDLDVARSTLIRDGFLQGYKMQFRNPATGRVFWGEVSVRIKNNVDIAEGSIIDITARKEAEEELRTLYSELEMRIADRTSELKTAQEAYQQANTKLNLLNAVTRHDVLNQLTVLNGYLSLLEMRATPSDPQMHEFLKRAEQAVRNIERQILFTKTYQDIGVHAPTWQNVEGLIKKAKTGLLPESIILTIGLGNLEIYADPLLEKTFYTLLENALRHGMPVSEIRFFYHVTGDEVLHLIYEDNGVGISFEDKAHIFERGYGKNTGFGLFLAREILSITGLVITETGEPGKGARFEISIPKDGYRFVP
ncbi:MAG: PAS domain S-box protein [Methanoregula sp.]|nr:PAS domain S-box protein [Methanoregula sp.]